MYSFIAALVAYKVGLLWKCNPKPKPVLAISGNASRAVGRDAQLLGLIVSRSVLKISCWELNRFECQ